MVCLKIEHIVNIYVVTDTTVVILHTKRVKFETLQFIVQSPIYNLSLIFVYYLI